MHGGPSPWGGPFACAGGGGFRCEIRRRGAPLARRGCALGGGGARSSGVPLGAGVGRPYLEKGEGVGRVARRTV